jgi:hypothetical protein
MARGVKWFGLTSYETINARDFFGTREFDAIAEGIEILGKVATSSDRLCMPVRMLDLQDDQKVDVVIRNKRIIRELRLVAHRRLENIRGIVPNIVIKAFFRIPEPHIFILEDEKGRRIYVDYQSATLHKPLPSKEIVK